MKQTFLATAAVLVLGAGPAAAQCILDPAGAGANGQTRVQNFLTLVHNLYAAELAPTHTLSIDGKTLQVPPWYTRSDSCDASHLKSGFGVTSPSSSDYLVVSDELSELATITALSTDPADDGRMMAIHNTIQAMASTTYPGLPCWVAEVTGNTVTCRDPSSATDATARFGLAYYYAANNPAFPAASRTLYRGAGDALAARHLAVEYASGCWTSSVTGNSLCHWVAGGSGSATAGVAGLQMWNGYFQDVARFLLAAYVSTGDSTYADRAREVVDQWLIANRFDGSHLSFGSKDFTWDTTGPLIAPRFGAAWDDSDAPRALWMGDVLRAFDLATHHAALTGAYAKLSTWVQLLLAAPSQATTNLCIQYNPDGSVAGNCGTDFYYNGLGAGLDTFFGTAMLAPRIDEALSQYDWSGVHNWHYTACFGIYRGVRPVKALAAAIGLDATTYGGTSCTATHSLTVTAAGTGSGSVTSSPAGISCGAACTSSFASGTAVTLSATSDAGSAFAGWSGACSGTGSCNVTLDADRAVTASFGAVSPPTAPTWLRVDTIAGQPAQLELTWQDNSNNETGFHIERKLGCCGPWTPLSDASANGTGTAIVTDGGLQCGGTSYAYRVWAWNAGGASAKTNEAARQTLPCS